VIRIVKKQNGSSKKLRRKKRNIMNHNNPIVHLKTPQKIINTTLNTLRSNRKGYSTVKRKLSWWE
jgi:hypothetical protein